LPRVKTEYRTASRENYTLFQELHPGTGLSFSQWQNIIYHFNYAFRDHLLETGGKAKLPWGFGNFCIGKKKLKKYKTLPNGTQKINLRINWKRTREEGRYIYHTNFHTDSYNFYWRWEPRSCRFYQSSIWRFKPARETSRLLTHYLNQEGYQHLYREWDAIVYA
jgi:hypothetical protein